MNKSESPILIWCLCPYILSSLITSHLNESTQRYCIYTSDDYCNYLGSHGINPNIQLLKASSLRISRVQRFLHNIFVYFICSNKLSKLWSRDRTKFLSQSFFKRLTILFNLGFSPGSIRPIYLRVMRMFPPSIFTHCEIYVYTPCYDYFCSLLKPVLFIWFMTVGIILSSIQFFFSPLAPIAGITLFPLLLPIYMIFSLCFQ